MKRVLIAAVAFLGASPYELEKPIRNTEALSPEVRVKQYRRAVLGFSLAVATVLVSLSCGGSSPSSPSSTSKSGAVPVIVTFAPVNATYTASLNNQTYTATGGFTVNLAPGTYTVTGSFKGQGFGVNFATLGTGGVVSGSVLSVSGPSDRQVTGCQVIYFNFDSPSTSRNFQVQFQVSANAGSACQGF